MYGFAKTLTEPFLLLVVIGWLAARRQRRMHPGPTSRLAYRMFSLLWLLSLPVVGWFAIWTLERDVIPGTAAAELPEQLDAIVILGGGIRVEEDPQDARPANGSMTRCLHAIDIAKGTTAMFVVCGGVPQQLEGAPSEARVMRDFLVEMGIPNDRILLEEDSRTTWENAVNASELIREQGFENVALVTQGWHLQRASACFRKLGQSVIPSGCEWNGPLKLPWYRHVLPTLGSLERTQTGTNEWIGMLWYHFKGRL